jgi:hypothetical protein
VKFTAIHSTFTAAFFSIGTVPASAHHSFASEFDREQPFEVEGVVTGIEWTNPHGWLLFDVEEEGETINYRVELPSPSQLMRQGWRRNDLMPDEKITVTGFRARTRHNVGRATLIQREDGEEFFRGTRLDN